MKLGLTGVGCLVCLTLQWVQYDACGVSDAEELRETWQRAMLQLDGSDKRTIMQEVLTSLKESTPMAADFLLRLGRRHVDDVSDAQSQYGGVSLFAVLRRFDAMISELGNELVLTSEIDHFIRTKAIEGGLATDAIGVIGKTLVRAVSEVAVRGRLSVWETCMAKRITAVIRDRAPQPIRGHVAAVCDVMTETGSPYKAVKGTIMLTQQLSNKTEPMSLRMLIEGLDSLCAEQGDCFYSYQFHQRRDLDNGCEDTGRIFQERKEMTVNKVVSDNQGVAMGTWHHTDRSLLGEHSVIGRSIVIHRHEKQEGRDSLVACCVIREAPPVENGAGDHSPRSTDSKQSRDDL